MKNCIEQLQLEPQPEETHLMTYAHIKDSNQTAQLLNLIRVFVICMKKLCMLGYPKYAQPRFRSDCANAQSDLNLGWAHMSRMYVFLHYGSFVLISDRMIYLILVLNVLGLKLKHGSPSPQQQFKLCFMGLQKL